jgi:hypothetical protein
MLVRRVLSTLTLLLALAVLAPSARVTAQQSAPERATVRGVVVDKIHGDPLPNAIVVLDGANRGTLTDAGGRFTFSGVPLGAFTLAAKQYGYDEVNLEIDVTMSSAPLRVELPPGPLALEGFTVIAKGLATMTQRLENRRNAYYSSVRALDQEKLATSTAFDVAELLRFSAGVRFAGCRGGGGPANSFQRVSAVRPSVEGYCVERRGRVVEPTVYIDEARVIGGLGFLASFKPYELALVEVYAGGAQIRAYTHWYMERLAEHPEQLFPLEL